MLNSLQVRFHLKSWKFIHPCSLGIHTPPPLPCPRNLFQTAEPACSHKWITTRQVWQYLSVKPCERSCFHSSAGTPHCIVIWEFLEQSTSQRTVALRPSTELSFTPADKIHLICALLFAKAHRWRIRALATVQVSSQVMLSGAKIAYVPWDLFLVRNFEASGLLASCSLKAWLFPIFFKVTHCWSWKTQGPQGHPPTLTLLAAWLRPNFALASTKHRRGNANSLHCCSGALLLKQKTVKKNSRSPASCHLSELVSQAVLQCHTALLLPSRLIPKLQPMERPAASARWHTSPPLGMPSTLLKSHGHPEQCQAKPN